MLEGYSLSPDPHSEEVDVQSSETDTFLELAVLTRLTALRCTTCTTCLTTDRCPKSLREDLESFLSVDGVAEPLFSMEALIREERN